MYVDDYKLYFNLDTNMQQYLTLLIALMSSVSVSDTRIS